jgi:hypothetical protein
VLPFHDDKASVFSSNITTFSGSEGKSIERHDLACESGPTLEVCENRHPSTLNFSAADAGLCGIVTIGTMHTSAPANITSPENLTDTTPPADTNSTRTSACLEEKSESILRPSLWHKSMFNLLLEDFKRPEAEFWAKFIGVDISIAEAIQQDSKRDP